jgi:methanogenic corrinoid protein MtbC1
MTKELFESIISMNENSALEMTSLLLQEESDPMEVLGIYRSAMAEIGRRFEAGEFFLPELILSGEMLRQASEMIRPVLKQGEKVERKGTVIIGTVEGDIHDIGKDIVVLLLDVNGYEVVDLGVDVPPLKFVETIQECNPQVIGLSGFLTLAYDPMKQTVESLHEKGLRNAVKVMIGGGQMDQTVCSYVGADAYGKDAVEAVKLCDQWIIGGA